LIFLHPDQRPTLLQEVMRYQQHCNHAEDEGYIKFLRRLADPLRHVLPAGARGLDYGCGPTAVMAQVLESHGYPTVSYDPLFHPDEALLAGLYNFVTCCEVVEHVHDPWSMLALMARLLRGGGVLGVMTRFHGTEAPFRSWWYRRDPTHVCFYSARTMRWIAGSRGWDVDLASPNVALFGVTA
jgi:hypothetical protein